ncbi:N-acetyltransferase [Sphingomonas psychrotolerans]|uniref:N-acetyltransferase n=1 Tax=Sphingomonas psychrotolerans TaxID=1327635 RepID=A0ABU3NA49_9SPHN|nr:GNAT family N-acetyltransferase [Sphingomonas psychrotolerans]MDT8760381.1 N-acetyltransferase [Sphingomonas psychrotolerans]
MSDVRDNKDEQRFELIEQGHLAFAEYRIEGEVITFTHTIVPASLQGMGVGSRLIEGALSEVRKRGLKVRATCTFVAAYLARHPEWQDLKA